MNPLYNLITLLLLWAPSAYCAGPRFIFVFGDSYSGTNFNIDGTKPTQSNPLGNPAYGSMTSCDTGGVTNCPNWVEVLTRDLSASNTLTFNFALGGSVINNKDSTVTDAWYNFTSQLSTWTNKVASKPSYAPWTGSNSVAIAWYGVNDILGIGSRSPNYKASVSAEFHDIFINFQWMYNYGVRRFVVFNAPPFAKNPSFNGNQYQDTYNGNVSYWNSVLPSAASDWAKGNSGAVVKVLDTNTPFNAILSNPSKYPSPWADQLHPGRDIQYQVAKSAYSVLSSIGFYA